MGITTVVWSGISNTGRVLGLVRICQCDMDTSRLNQLEPGHSPELRVRGPRLCVECSIPGEKPVACGQCDRGEGQQSTRHWGRGTACWLSHCDQDYIFRVSLSGSNITHLHTDRYYRHGSPAVKDAPKEDGSAAEGAERMIRSLFGV